MHDAYEIEWSKRADEHMRMFRKSNRTKLLNKIYFLVEEIALNPRRGTGRPEPLKIGKGLWSRRINHEHRLVYKIIEKEKVVLIHSVMTHYGDK